MTRQDIPPGVFLEFLGEVTKSLTKSESRCDVVSDVVLRMHMAEWRRGHILMNWMNSSMGKPKPPDRFKSSNTMRKITDIPDIDKPREKMIKRDVSTLSNVELPIVLIKMGVLGAYVLQVASEVERWLYGHVGEGVDLI